MSENLVIVSKVEDVKRRNNLKANELCGTVKTPSIVSGGDLTWVITSKDPTTLQTMSFGFTPHWVRDPDRPAEPENRCW